MIGRQLRSRIAWVICGDDKGGPTWPHVEDLYIRLDEQQRLEAKEYILSLIQSDEWPVISKPKSMIRIYQARAVGACGVLGFTDAEPLIVRYIEENKRDLASGEHYPLLFAIKRLKIRRLYHHLLAVDRLDWLASHKGLVGRNEVAGDIEQSFATLISVDPDMALEYAEWFSAAAPSVEDGRIELVIMALTMSVEEIAKVKG